MPTIHVVLIDAATQQPLGEVDLPPEQLPESFASATTLQLGDEDWRVEHAEPLTRAEALVAGGLHLVIRRIMKVDPSTVLFTLPTLENALPPMEDGDGEALRLHEDDWRQVELIAPALEPEIAVELAAIREVHGEREGPGFRRIHVRERIPEPLIGVSVEIEAVRRGVRRQVSFHDHPGVVSGGFAFDVGDGAIYGREEVGGVQILGLWRADPGLLRDLARAHRLLIVDWCAARIIYPR